MMQNQEITIVDVRDSAAFSHGRIPGAISLSNDNIEQFIEQLKYTVRFEVFMQWL